MNTAATGSFIARQDSMAGPCINIGTVTHETAQFFTCVRAYDGRVTKVSKRSVHIEPCRCCRDSADTMYSHGYSL